MAATAAYSADVLVSSGGVHGSQTHWEYSVPVRQDVRPLSLFLIAKTQAN